MAARDLQFGGWLLKKVEKKEMKEEESYAFRSQCLSTIEWNEWASFMGLMNGF